MFRVLATLQLVTSAPFRPHSFGDHDHTTYSHDCGLKKQQTYSQQEVVLSVKKLALTVELHYCNIITILFTVNLHTTSERLLTPLLQNINPSFRRKLAHNLWKTVTLGHLLQCQAISTVFRPMLPSATTLETQALILTCKTGSLFSSCVGTVTERQVNYAGIQLLTLGDTLKIRRNNIKLVHTFKANTPCWQQQ